MKLIFKELYLFSTVEKAAKKLTFSNGINVITSNQVNGTDRGKSVILRSLYHSLGADARFDDKWDDKNKIYILHLSIEEKDFYIYRSADLFKFFNDQKELLFITTNRNDLAEKLLEYTGFAVQLPNRTTQKLEITPPVYNYLINFLDQDYYNGTTFSSFGSLGQYKDYKENVLYYHFGAYDQNYFNLIRQREEHSEEQITKKNRFHLLQEMQKNVDKKLEGNQISSNLQVLNTEIELYKKDYTQILSLLSKSKERLLDLRNQETETLHSLSELETFSKKNNTDIKKLQAHRCPECDSILENVVTLRSKRFNVLEDIILLKNKLQTSLLGISKNIQHEETKYDSLLQELKQYEEKMKINSAQINDILRHKGFLEIRDGIILEKNSLNALLEQLEKNLSDIQKQIKKYADKKRQINEKYYTLLMDARTKFGLNEIDPDSFKSITKTFSASGSNKPIATVIWYMTLIALRKEFNPSAIALPVVFDSPNNAETDDIKRHDLLQFILDSTTSDTQLILSSIGFEKDKFNCNYDINVMLLENEKYHLLDEISYNQYYDLLNFFCNAK